MKNQFYSLKIILLIILILNIFTQYKSTSEWGERDRERKRDRGDRERGREKGREIEETEKEREKAQMLPYTKRLNQSIS